VKRIWLAPSPRIEGWNVVPARRPRSSESRVVPARAGSRVAKPSSVRASICPFGRPTARSGGTLRIFT
jgi:hypothetical protein